MKHLTLVKLLIAANLLLYAYSLWQRQPDVDDAWIGEHAFWLAKNGFVRSDLMYGITSQETRQIVHHKLFTLNGALFVKTLGFSLLTLKSVSLVWFMGFLVLFLSYVKRKLGEEASWLALLLITTNAFIFQYSFVYRPEIMVMTLGFASYIFMEKYLRGTGSWHQAAMSGAFAALAATAHLNGLIFIAAGLAILLLRWKLKAILVFGTFSGLFLTLYFYDFTADYNFRFWLHQINDSPALHKSQILPSSLLFIGKPFNEHLRFFHSPKEISQSLLLIFLLLINFRTLKQESLLLQYAAALVVFLSLLAVHTTSKYMLLYLPFIVLIITTSFMDIYRQRASGSPLRWGFTYGKTYRWSLGLLALLLATHLFWNFSIAAEKFDPGRNRLLSQKYFGSQTEKLKVLAPMTFIFDEMGRFGRIQSDLGIAEMQKAGRQLSGKRLLHYADSLKVDYVLITDEYRSKFGMDTLDANNYSKLGYRIAGAEAGLLVLGRNR